MEIIDPEQKRQYEMKRGVHDSSSGRILGGVVIILIGIVLLLRKMGYWFPDWIFSWQTLLIAVGLFIGARNRFVPGGWLIPVVIGSIFLFDRWIPGFSLRPFFWPVVLIIVGVIMILTSGGRNLIRSRSKSHYDRTLSTTSDEVMESVSVFGGIRKNVISKNFRGGEVTCVFGSAVINLMEAGIQGRIELEVNQIFGGAELIVPSDWIVITEVSAVFGSVEDVRLYTKENANNNKVLVLKGNAFLGGITIKSY